MSQSQKEEFDKLKIKLKRVLIFFKENPTFSALIITVLGGMWQLSQLNNISISYIRFFSISQLLPDGLFIIISFLTFTIFYIVSTLNLYFLLESFEKDEYISKKNLNKFKLKIRKIEYFSYKTAFLNLLFIGGIIGFNYWFIKNEFFSENKYAFYFYQFIWQFILIVILKYCYKIAKDAMKRLFAIDLVLVILTSLMVFVSLANKFNYEYLYPKNLKNFDELVKTIKTENPKAKVSIRYYNDNYIFVEIKKVNNLKVSKDTIDKIEIVKLEEVLTKFKP